MSVRWRAPWARARESARQKRRIQLAIEELEPVLLLSVAPAEASHAEWREQVFSIDSLWEVGLPSGESGAGSAAQQSGQALAAQALTLIGGGQVHQQYGYTGSGYSVAVIDTGLDYSHPAFAGRYWGGYDFVDDDTDPMDEQGHGTHVAGIIASSHNTYRGVAPDAGIVALRVLDADGNGNFGDVESALQWVSDHRAQYNIVAVNMSLGTGNFTSNPWSFMEDELQTLKDQGVFLAAASGNSYFSYGSQQGLGYPAISSLTVSVGAVWDGNYGSVSWSSGAMDYGSATDRVTSFTQRSAQLDLLAPGALITSAYLGGGYASLAGTSMAAPYVAGAAVLLRQALDANAQSHLANQDHIRDVMRATGVTVVDGDDEDDNVMNTGLSFARLDIFSAVQHVVSAGTPAPPPPPPLPTPTQARAYVTELYQRVLTRAPESGGLNYWAGGIEVGMPRHELVHALWTSPEHRASQVYEYYADYLGRTPTSDDLDFWVGAFLSGASESDVVSHFLHSIEYVSSPSDDTAFVNAVYTDLLARPADGPGLSSWVTILDQGASRGDVVEAIFHSRERHLLAVNEYYQDFLGRSPSQGEQDYWASAIEQGQVTLEDVGQAFLASEEYFNIAGGASSAGAQSAGARAAEGPGQGGVREGRTLGPWGLVGQGGVSRRAILDALFENQPDVQDEVLPPVGWFSLPSPDALEWGPFASVPLPGGRGGDVDWPSHDDPADRVLDTLDRLSAALDEADSV